MVVGAFPAIKLAVLLFKQISKPIANYAKERAKSNTFFRTYICMPPAQFYNWCEIKSKMWIMNLGKPVAVPPLNEQMAIELGANMLGEGIIFILGAAVLIVEYNRSANKEAAKEKQRVDEMNKLIDTVNELYFSSQMQQTKIREMQTMIGDLESEVFHRPRPPSDDSSLPPPPPPDRSHPQLEHVEDPPKELRECRHKLNIYKTSFSLNDYGDESRVVTKPWTLKHKSDSNEPPPPPGGIHAPLEPLKVPEILEENDKKSKTKKEKEDKSSIPFPERNLVMKSLNYVELDVRNVPAPVKVEVPLNINNDVLYERKPNFLMDALSYLEHDVRGLLT